MSPSRKMGDRSTPDLFDRLPRSVAVGFAPEQELNELRGDRLGSRISRAVAMALKASPMGRGAIAEQMSQRLGRPVSKDMLDAYASETRDGHQISLERFIVLMQVTERLELLGFVAQLFGHVVVPAKFEPLIELSLIEEHEKAVAHRKATLQARWRAGR